jgi:hypothetical protein
MTAALGLVFVLVGIPAITERNMTDADKWLARSVEWSRVPGRRWSGPAYVRRNTVFLHNGRVEQGALDPTMRAADPTLVEAVSIVTTRTEFVGVYGQPGSGKAAAYAHKSEVVIIDRLDGCVVATRSFSADPPSSIRINSAGRTLGAPTRADSLPDAIRWISSLPVR